MIRHTIFGVIALAVAALDFFFSTRTMMIAGVVALTVSVYSFARAHRGGWRTDSFRIEQDPIHLLSEE